MWSELKCQRNKKDTNLGIGQRSMGFELLSDSAELDDPEFLEKNKTLCSFDGYSKRNDKLFDNRNGLAQDPQMTKAIFHELAEFVSKVGDNALFGCDMRKIIPNGPIQIPCDITYVSKNEQSCQIAARLSRMVDYLIPSCDTQRQYQVNLLVRRLKILTTIEGQTCPDIGTDMTNEIRQKALRKK